MSALTSTSAVLASAVANNGTVAIPYPAGFTRADLIGTTGGSVAVDDNDRYPQASSGAGTVGLSFGASTITITNRSGITWAAGARLIASFGTTDRLGGYNLTTGPARNQAARGDGSGNPIQELTATAAFTPDTRILELNHASVVIAAAIDALLLKGLFIIRNTSASGTAAHTVTLTNGTFNGTNTVATLNAPGEALIVFFDDFGRGQIIENTGAVGLS